MSLSFGLFVSRKQHQINASIDKILKFFRKHFFTKNWKKIYPTNLACLESSGYAPNYFLQLITSSGRRDQPTKVYFRLKKQFFLKNKINVSIESKPFKLEKCLLKFARF